MAGLCGERYPKRGAFSGRGSCGEGVNNPGGGLSFEQRQLTGPTRKRGGWEKSARGGIMGAKEVGKKKGAAAFWG